RHQSARKFGDELRRALIPVKEPPHQQPLQVDPRRLEAPTLRLPMLSRYKRWLMAAAILFIVIVGALFWSLSSKTLSAKEVAASRIQGKDPTTGNGRIYGAYFGFPTGQPPKDTIYAGIGGCPVGNQKSAS